MLLFEPAQPILTTMKVRVNIETRTFIKLALVTLAFAIGVVAIIKARQPLILIGLSLFLALALNPPVNAIAKRLPGRSRVGATAIAYVLVLTFLGGITVMVAPPVIEQTARFARSTPAVIEDLSNQQYIVQNFIDRYELNEAYDNAVENAKNRAAGVAASMGNLIVDGAGSLLNGIVSLIIVVVLAFLMLIEGPSWMKLIWGLYKDQQLLERHRDVVYRMYRVVTGFVNGQMLIAGIAGLSTLVAIVILALMFDFQASLAVPLAVIVALTGFVPMIGATLGAILVSLVLLFNSVPATIIFVAFFIIYQQVENNFISPLVQSKVVDLSALMVLSAVLIGVSVFGIIGGIISIPIAGCIRVILVDYLEHAEGKREASKAKNSIKKIAKGITK